MLTLRQQEDNSGTPEAIQIQNSRLVGFKSTMHAIYDSLSDRVFAAPFVYLKYSGICPFDSIVDAFEANLTSTLAFFETTASSCFRLPHDESRISEKLTLIEPL